jgi:hypothetical protein
MALWPPVIFATTDTNPRFTTQNVVRMIFIGYVGLPITTEILMARSILCAPDLVYRGYVQSVVRLHTSYSLSCFPRIVMIKQRSLLRRYCAMSNLVLRTETCIAAC